MHYISLGVLLITLGFVIGVYVHTDKKIEKLSDKMDRLSDEIKENNKSLNDRMDRLYDILVHMGFRDKEYRDKAANE
ncbi:MAG: hypothetical protein EVG15_04870 [Candidatus Acididesulfobacter diazotrophicus]|jgi:signal transduction histidine kinase|uniref:Uncharacterized protein n=1 Tax=Candidatus Acididesulfobacter diazotrophicus TaxID=2597226 RepID=A0A519BN68_9DELT|nr:MAG: hypothetical protein EVG15_04870 [Candidatus Acididesulfobacter diazotrophicus]